MAYIKDFGKNTAIIGASADRSRFSNKAVRAFTEEGFTVFPVHPKEEKIEWLKVYKSLKDIPEKVDFASVYLNPEISLKIDIAKQLKEKGVKPVILNPGAESPELVEKLEKNGLKVLQGCSIRGLGRYPDGFSE